VNYKSFAVLPYWQRARELCRVILNIVNQKRFRDDYSLKNQIWRAAGSVMDHIAEGFDDGLPREFTCFSDYAQRLSYRLWQFLLATLSKLIDKNGFKILRHRAGIFSVAGEYINDRFEMFKRSV